MLYIRLFQCYNYSIMDRQEYLNQISAKNRPVKGPSKLKSILTSKLFWFVAGAVVLMILMMVVGTAIGKNKEGMDEKLYSLKLHIDNTSNVMNSYQNLVKSSVLRSGSASLSSIMTNTSRDLDEYISANYPEIAETKREKAESAADEAKESLTTDLFEAKINGILDRTYAHKLTYEISMLMTEEETIASSTSDDILKEIIATSYESMEKLYATFSDFSETK